MGLVTINDLLTQPTDVIAKYMSWAGDLKDMYERFILNDDEGCQFVAGWGSAKGRAGGVHASELSSDCRRPVWYSLRGTPRTEVEIDPFWKKRFRIGHMYHAMVQEDWRRLCEQSGGLMSFEREAKIHPDLQPIAQQYGITSHCDGILTFRDFPWGPAVMRVGLEIKTESPDQYAQLKGPKAQHLKQTCVYMKCLDVPLLWTMYWNKGNQNIVESKPPFLYMFDNRLWNEIEQSTKEVIHLATINEIPNRVEGIGCSFCGFSHVCGPDFVKKQKARDEARKKRAVQQERLKKHRNGGIRMPKELL